MNIDISLVLTKLTQKRDKTFQYRDKNLSLEEVFADNGALPILVKKANLLMDFLFGRKLQVSFVSDPTSLTGEKVVIMPEQSAFIMVMILYDVVEELMIGVAGKVVTLS